MEPGHIFGSVGLRDYWWVKFKLYKVTVWTERGEAPGYSLACR